MIMQHDPIDVASQSMQMLSAFDDCLLARYRWIIQAMRSLMVGESRPALQSLPGFERCLPRSLGIPSTLLQRFETERTKLEALCDQVADVKNIRIDLPLYQQLDELQRCSEYFMRQSDEACRRLRCDFALRDPPYRGPITPHAEARPICRPETCTRIWAILFTHPAESERFKRYPRTLERGL